MHQPGSGTPVSVDELFPIIVEADHYLFPGQRWLDVRLRHLGSHPLTIPWDGAIYQALHDEMALLVETLSAERLRCLGFAKAARVYPCPACHGPFAQLQPDDAVATLLSC